MTSHTVGGRRVEMRFRRDTGGEVGRRDVWSTHYNLAEDSSVNRAKCNHERQERRRQVLASRLGDVVMMRKLSLDQLERIQSIVDEATP